MTKKFNIIAGLPRSGSTLLCNILNQNPDFHASNTSGLVRVLSGVKTGWEQVIEHKTNIDFDRKKNVLKAVAASYYENEKSKVVFDKNRSWMSEPELAKIALGEDVKYIITVRNLTDILASFEKLFRSQNGYFDISDKINNSAKFSTIQGRCELWSSFAGPIGSTFNSLKELLNRDANVMMIEYKDLTENPEIIIKNLYKFIEENHYEHDFNNVEQSTHEEDYFHGILDLHKIRNKVEPFKSNAVEILGPELFNKYSGAEFWRK